MSWRVFRLTELHRKTDELIRREEGRKVPNPFEIMRLKKLRLAIKDRLAALTRRPSKA
jgi:uncharacterized protein YdcH (DUF465 family)